MFFPEEPLDLPPSEGGGYFPATIHQKMNDGKYEIVRKLGYGPSSSIWLVYDNDRFYSVKILTVAASERARNRPKFGRKRCFWEGSNAGSHLCFVTDIRTSVQALQRQAENQQLPAHVVQRVVGSVVSDLCSYHNAQIMYGAIKADNIFLIDSADSESLQQFLDSKPKPTIVKIKKYTTVRSQPINRFKWNAGIKHVADWSISVGNFEHIQEQNYEPEKAGDYFSAPETLLHEASCSPQTDIWMLGYVTFQLLTGDPPFYLNGKVAKRIAAMRAILGDEIPEEWLHDRSMKFYDAESVEGMYPFIDETLADVGLDREAAAFIKGCLRLDPGKRFTAEECRSHKWLAMANACSCRFH